MKSDTKKTERTAAYVLATTLVLIGTFTLVAGGSVILAIVLFAAGLASLLTAGRWNTTS